MWWTILYIVGGIVIVAIAVVYYLFKKGLAKVKPDPLKGIPVPPMTHSVLGHPDKMLHPLKHELRLEVCEAARAPHHQLVLMKHSSVFINDAEEAGKLFQELPTKGVIYNAFRYDANIPDLLASDGPAWEVRHKALAPALSNIQFDTKNEESITAALLNTLTNLSESTEPVDLVGLFTYLALDVVCEAAFGFALGAVAGSEDGKKMYQSLCSLADAQANVGIYASSNVRKVPPEEISGAKAFWKGFLNKLLGVVRTDSEQYRARNGELDVEHNFGHALIQLSVTEESYGDAQLISEIHQVLRHGYETIAGTLVWTFFALYRNPKVRAKLESELAAHKPTDAAPYPEYLECVLKETMRRYPVAGNMTVRTVDKPDLQLPNGATIPVGTPVHFHMFSLQNTTRAWLVPKEFQPDRWLVSEEHCFTVQASAEDARDGRNPSAGPPRCPFMHATTAYDGAGHTERAISFFPFSAGARACPAKTITLQVLRRVVSDVALKFRIDPYEAFWDADNGNSVNATIMPFLKKSTTVRIRKMTELGVVQKGAVLKAEEGEVGAGAGGWADEDDDDDEKYQKVEKPTEMEDDQ